MNTEEVARRLSSSRAGFTLIGYQEVGLPYWQLSLECVILNRKEVPALAEFAMRAMASGLPTVEDISGFLGLEESIVASVLAPLFQDDFIHLSSERDGCFELTQSGERLLRTCEFVVPEETVFTLDYDGWTRRLVDLGNVTKDTPGNLKKRGIWALPAFPADPPNADDITVAEVRALVSGVLEKRQKGTVVGAEVLSIEGLHDKRRIFYRQAIALLFKSVQSSDVQVAFAVDGRLSQAHEDAFTEAAGLKKLGVLEALKESSTDSASLGLDADLLSIAVEGPEVIELARSARLSKRDVLRRQEALGARGADPVIAEAEIAALDEAKEKLDTIEAKLTQYPVRMLEVYEHPDILQEALAEAQERLLIISPWIKSAVVSDDFIASLESCLARGVSVAIGYGINSRKPAEGSDTNALRRLEALAGKHENLVVAALGDTHSKVLVLDRRYVVITSFNWLSFRGDASKPFRDERGVLVVIPDEIDNTYDSLMKRVLKAVESCRDSEH